MVENVAVDRAELPEIIDLVGGERGLIEVVQMALGENYDASLPFWPGDHNRCMPAS